ncbi:Protein of unknown function [Lactobacillus helveticus CIRM-BIA 101]|jgi:hypothetical protein
MKME